MRILMFLDDYGQQINKKNKVKHLEFLNQDLPLYL